MAPSYSKTHWKRWEASPPTSSHGFAVGGRCLDPTSRRVSAIGALSFLKKADVGLGRRRGKKVEDPRFSTEIGAPGPPAGPRGVRGTSGRTDSDSIKNNLETF